MNVVKIPSKEGNMMTRKMMKFITNKIIQTQKDV